MSQRPLKEWRYTLPFLVSVLDGSECSSFTLLPLYPWKNSPPIGSGEHSMIDFCGDGNKFSHEVFNLPK
jgi:hypothetical protein